MIDQKSQLLGALKINYVVYFYLALVLFCPLYTYHMAITHKEEDPFPHVTVTNTACHYPQSIIFRWMMTSAGCFLTLIYMAIFKWVEQQAKKIQYPYSTMSWIYTPAQLSIIGYLTAIGTIDNGGTGDAHTIGAVFFFIVLFLAVIGQTYVIHQMRRWDTSCVSWKSYIMKCGLAIYLLALWIYCLFGLIFEVIPTATDDDIYIVIVEWNSVYVGLIWVLSFAFDWKHYYICLSRSSGVQMIETD